MLITFGVTLFRRLKNATQFALLSLCLTVLSGCLNKVLEHTYFSRDATLRNGVELNISLQGTERKIDRRSWIRGTPFRLAILAKNIGENKLCISHASVTQASRKIEMKLDELNCGQVSQTLLDEGIDRGYLIHGLDLQESEDAAVVLRLSEPDKDAEYRIKVELKSESKTKKTFTLMDAVRSV